QNSGRADTVVLSQARMRRKLWPLGETMALAASRGTNLVGNGLIDELPEEIAMVSAQLTLRLHHENRDQLLLRVNPEVGSRVAGPSEFTGRTRQRRQAIRQAHAETQTKRKRRRVQNSPTHCRCGGQARSQMIGSHEPDRRAA